MSSVTGEEMSLELEINQAVVIDDALGAPARGTVSPDDKDTWIDAVSEDASAQNALRQIFYAGAGPELDPMLAELTGQPTKLDMLWTEYQKGMGVAARLDLLFKGAELHRNSKLEKAQTVVDKLTTMIGAPNVQAFSTIQAASAALAKADVAFVDFYLSNSEQEGAAIERIKNHAEALSKPKLLFFMSSRASIDVQKSVREKIGKKSAFFEVMRKSDITADFLAAKLEAKRASYASNKLLEGLVKDLVSSTETALKEFVSECDELEVHDLRMLDLARLSAEGESLGEYLTWLFSESIAAKARRLAMPTAIKKIISEDAIGFTGQLGQGKVLSSQFSEIVFGPPVQGGKPVRFGELLKRKDTQRYLLTLTPACDLQRCEPSKLVLCVEGSGETYTGSKAFAKEKLYGKQEDGRLCHLLTRIEGEIATSTMIKWDQGQVVMHTVQELGGQSFERVALMNELFAQEAKEEVLRVLGRVGTQIDPPPSMALHAKIRWKFDGKTYREAEAPKHEFISALLSYSEQKDGKSRKRTPTVVLSDEFRLWLRAKIEADQSTDSIPKKLQNCLDTAVIEKQLPLPSKFTTKVHELVVKVHDSEGESMDATNAFLQIDLWSM